MSRGGRFRSRSFDLPAQLFSRPQYERLVRFLAERGMDPARARALLDETLVQYARVIGNHFLGDVAPHNRSLAKARADTVKWFRRLEEHLQTTGAAQAQLPAGLQPQDFLKLFDALTRELAFQERLGARHAKVQVQLPGAGADLERALTVVQHRREAAQRITQAPSPDVSAGQQRATTRPGLLDAVLDAAGREDPQLAADLLRDLGRLGDQLGPGALDGVADFLRRGPEGSGRVVRTLLEQAAKQKWEYGSRYLDPFLAKVKEMDQRQLAGVLVTMRERGFDQDGMGSVVHISNNFGRDAPQIFGAVQDLDGHSEGLRPVIGYLRSLDGRLNQAAAGTINVGHRLLREFPGSKLLFEAEAIGGGRYPDVTVVERSTGERLLEAELKEISEIWPWQEVHRRAQRHRGRPRRGPDQLLGQFAKDIVRSVRASKLGQAPLAGIRLIVREREIAAELAELGTTPRNELRRILSQVFDFEKRDPNDPIRRAMSQLTAEDLAAARHDFETNFDRIVYFQFGPSELGR